jgi:hypothetical protein
MHWKYPSSLSNKKFKVTQSAGKVMLLTHFRSDVKVQILPCTIKFCCFIMQFTENVRATWQEEFCFIMTMPDPIQPKPLRRELKNYSENFLNIHLTAWTWPLVSSIC